MATHPMLDRQSRERDQAKLRARNLRTGLVLFAIALVFFVGVIVSRFMGGYVIGIGIVGFAILIFLVFAIGRNIKSGD